MYIGNFDNFFLHHCICSKPGLFIKVGDKLGLCVQSDGSLHFYYNSVDLGPAASDLSGHFYGVVDIYGQAVQASITDSTANKGWWGFFTGFFLG
jgi:hypothetical protein